MPAITPLQAGGVNVCAFLDMIAWSEGTSISPDTQNDGYDVIVRGVTATPRIFLDYSKHPGLSVIVRFKPLLQSTAAGRYQVLERYAKAYIRSLKLPDFGPLSQDLIALQLIRECGALQVIQRGDFKRGVFLCRSRWASLSGAGYGQPEHPIEKLQAAYVEAGGSVRA